MNRIHDRGVRVGVRDSGGIALAVMEVRKAADAAGFNEHGRQTLATVVSELSNNMLKYASRGEIGLRQVAARGRIGIEVTASDRGPGIEDVERAMQDHFSSSGTLGLGLPGVKRMMDSFAIESEPGKGTRVTVIKWL